MHVQASCYSLGSHNIEPKQNCPHLLFTAIPLLQLQFNIKFKCSSKLLLLLKMLKFILVIMLKLYFSNQW